MLPPRVSFGPAGGVEAVKTRRTANRVSARRWDALSHPAPDPMATATAGDTVHVHYTGTLADGATFDSSDGRAPLSFTLGAGEVVPGFDAAVDGMAVGETRTVTVAPGDAYGERRPEMEVQVDRDQLPDGAGVGDRLLVGLAGGGQMPVTVTAVDGGTATLDANHELAGKALTFRVSLVRVG